MLSPARGKIIHVLLTRAPLYRGRSPFSCYLHVLSAPLTFVLSQDQTLQLNLRTPSSSLRRRGRLKSMVEIEPVFVPKPEDQRLARLLVSWRYLPALLTEM